MALNQLVEVRILRSQREQSMGGVPVHSVVLQTSREGFDSLSVHIVVPARVAQMAEATLSDSGGWGFESLVGYAGPVGPVDVGAAPSRRRSPVRIRYGAPRKGGRVVQGVVPLRRTGREAGVGSNPTPSAKPLWLNG